MCNLICIVLSKTCYSFLCCFSSSVPYNNDFAIHIHMFYLNFYYIYFLWLLTYIINTDEQCFTLDFSV